MHSIFNIGDEMSRLDVEAVGGDGANN